MILWEHFDKNEWYILSMLVITYGAIWLLPKRLPRSLLIAGFVWGFASSTLFDFTIGGGLMDFYRVNDTNRYELTDLLVYFMFAPFGYFFVYFFEVMKITRKTVIPYILGWTVLGVAVEWVSEQMGMTTYQHGYRLEYNVAVFLAVQTVMAVSYMYMKKHRLIGRQ
ncbi:hypothetical protein [Paenibacillus silviterrae]|uniref:hypothetical protein n=1 Tax=Paenibacillus silviterrae TaxID=3242194 RepID=UPI00254369C8|nr:hypothetical protein [Paenibacillus chinjuensis]